MTIAKKFYIQFGDESLKEAIGYHGKTDHWKTLADVIEAAEFEAKDAGLKNHPYAILNEKKEIIHRGLANSSSETN
jgi:hypothetical protein